MLNLKKSVQRFQVAIHFNSGNPCVWGTYQKFYFDLIQTRAGRNLHALITSLICKSRQTWSPFFFWKQFGIASPCSSNVTSPHFDRQFFKYKYKFSALSWKILTSEVNFAFLDYYWFWLYFGEVWWSSTVLQHSYDLIGPCHGPAKFRCHSFNYPMVRWGWRSPVWVRVS